ncbi:MAG: hypothetical protein IKN17_09720 [Ruminococcus sp.]|nr:hypothetical protein [Ruminococcus sp.]MBR6873768.1 hypothetical protein [Ruminococcus sp.]
MRTVPDELKIYELSKLWKEAEYDFAFWDKLHIDWDAEYKAALPRVLAAKDVYDYYKELRRFAALLCDRHTDVSNGYTFSAGEDFVDVMKAHTDAVFIDSPRGSPCKSSSKAADGSVSAQGAALLRTARISTTRALPRISEWSTVSRIRPKAVTGLWRRR